MYDAFAAGASMTYAKSNGTTPLIAAVKSGEFDAFPAYRVPSRRPQGRLNSVQLRRWLSGSEMPSFLSALGFDLMDECPL